MRFLLAQATRGSASAIVARREHYGNLDGWEAWLELERIYGGRGQDEQPVQLLALERRLRNIHCNSAEKSEAFIVKLDTIWGEFKAVGNVKADETKMGCPATRDQDSATRSLCPAHNPTKYVVGRTETGSRSAIHVHEVKLGTS